jgi:hypothetical protein
MVTVDSEWNRPFLTSLDMDLMAFVPASEHKLLAIPVHIFLRPNNDKAIH